MDKKLSKTIKLAIQSLFERTKARFLGSSYEGPRIFLQVVGGMNPNDTLEGAFRHALFMNLGARAVVDPKLLDAQEEEFETLVDALKERTTLDVLRAVNEGSEEKVIEAMGRAESHLDLIATTEVRRAQSVAETSSVHQFAAASGISDPTVFFIGVNDDKMCSICKKMYYVGAQPPVPKLFKLSEVKTTYLKKKEWDGETPHTAGHARCRHSMTILAPGFTIGPDGRVKWEGLGYDHYAATHGGSKPE